MIVADRSLTEGQMAESSRITVLRDILVCTLDMNGFQRHSFRIQASAKTNDCEP